MPFYKSNTFNPARGGHAPGHIRDAFLTAIEIRYKQRGGDPVVPVGYDDTPVPLSRLCGLLWNCTDILPGEDCNLLDIGPGSTYAIASRKLRAA